MGLFSDLKGTTENIFRIGTHAWKGITGGIAARNSSDSADEKVQASQFEATGDTGLVINSDSAGSAADWKITIARPTSGMTADYTLTLPIDDGSPSQSLITNGSGVLSWASAGSTADKMSVETTSLAFGTASPLTLFTTPSNAIIHKVQVIIDTAFAGGTPTVTVGIAGTTSKYMSSGQNVLTGTAEDIYESNPGKAAASESLIATYAAGGASSGAARILVYYSVPA
jgi:hypothetical protein